MNPTEHILKVTATGVMEPALILCSLAQWRKHSEYEFELEIKPGFLKTASYLENMTGPTGKSFNYSDAGSGGGLNPAMFWFAEQIE